MQERASVCSLLLAVLLSFYTFGKSRGFGREQILKFTNECLAPTASITLVVGAGAGFGRILIDSGASKAIVDVATGAHVPLLILAWLVAALIRVATGSATVAMATDFDCWHESHEDVTVEAIIAVMNKNVGNARDLIVGAVPALAANPGCACGRALQNAIMTAPDRISPEARLRLGLLIDKYVKR